MTTISVPDPSGPELLSGWPDDVPPDVEVLVWDGHDEPPEGAERIELFVGLYNAPPPPARVLAQLPSLRAVQLLSAGVEPWLPVVPDGVQLCNGRGIHGGSTAELAVAGMLAVLRDLPRFVRQQQEHTWNRPQTAGISGRRVLVLGTGDIGGRVAGVAELLDAEVTLVARRARDGVHALEDLPALLPRHDVVVVALPLTEETHHVVDRAALAAMPDGALLVNIARGGHVDTEALLAELRTERLAAHLDVVDPEPLPADHPLWDAPNLLLTPHVGGGTKGWERRAYRLVAQQVGRLRAGEQLVNRVTGSY